MKEKIDEMVTTGGALASHSPTDARRKAQVLPDGNFGGKPYFDCSPDIFAKCYKGRKKGQRWSTYLEADNEWARGVRTWARQTGNPDFLFRNTADNSFMYAQYGIMKEETQIDEATIKGWLKTFMKKGQNRSPMEQEYVKAQKALKKENPKAKIGAIGVDQNGDIRFMTLTGDEFVLRKDGSLELMNESLDEAMNMKTVKIGFPSNELAAEVAANLKRENFLELKVSGKVVEITYRQGTAYGAWSLKDLKHAVKMAGRAAGMNESVEIDEAMRMSLAPAIAKDLKAKGVTKTKNSEKEIISMIFQELENYPAFKGNKKRKQAQMQDDDFIMDVLAELPVR